jgi:hypothetical protein
MELECVVGEKEKLPDDIYGNINNISKYNNSSNK